MYVCVKKTIAVCSIFALGVLMFLGETIGAEEKKAVYVGSEACQACHEGEYERFTANARKAHSYESIRKMEEKLTPKEFEGCFECHTTGHGEPGGFRSVQETPHLKNAGCEVCHGPGSLHVESEDSANITLKVSVEVCNRCHVSDRVKVFRYKPMLHAGAH